MASPNDAVSSNSFSATARKIMIIGTDGLPSDSGYTMAEYVVISGSYTYVCQAKAGTALATAAWRIRRNTDLGSGNSRTEWADGNAKFDNVATNPAGLTYS